MRSESSFGVTCRANLRLIRFRFGSLRRALGSPGSSDSSAFSRAVLGVTGFIGVPVWNLVRAEVSPSSLRFAWVHSDAPKGHCVHSGWRGFASALLKVTGFIREFTRTR